MCYTIQNNTLDYYAYFYPRKREIMTTQDFLPVDQTVDIQDFSIKIRRLQVAHRKIRRATEFRSDFFGKFVNIRNHTEFYSLF